ncbi:CRISPR-associated helicase/endonuclease Cas3 [Halonatronum saccharophilum]|uniref:CRISPR-associated helicase/endonuclease Cas3 n=1 Tax=Halonatronum saccharophilum TaxID=150060 RepID=UPI000488ACDA|nr:CRISPR-associated helicase/endonuclease Cas3 [Halonatronum saccharophilum]
MDKLYSHYTKGDEKSKKTLYVHLKNVADNSKEKIENKELELSLIDEDRLAEISYLVGIAHDFGKATSYFQDYLIKGVENKLSHHGLISAFFGYLLVDKYYGDKVISLMAYMIIKKHHGNLESPLEDIDRNFDDIKEQLDDIKANSLDIVEKIYDKLLDGFEIDFGDILDELEEISEQYADDLIDDKFDDIIAEMEYKKDESIELFLITQLLYSALIDSDKKDAARVDNSYFEGAIEEKVSVLDYIENCRQENPEKFDPTNKINQKRNKFLDEVINNPELKKENYLYSLTAPTGIGKTFASFAFANKVKDFYNNGRRIIYCLPFTSIIDQNYEIFEKIIGFNLGKKYQKNSTKYLLRHHYLTPMRLKKDVDLANDSKETKNLDKYMEDKLLLESWESANIVTTFVQIFESIIGNRNSSLKKFHNIINSIIILDEVQNIPPKYYRIVGMVLKVLAKRFNTYILLLTATQPEMIKGEDVVSLVDDEKYAKDYTFDRVNLEIIDNLREVSLDKFIECFDERFNSRSALIVCNTIKSALSLFEIISDSFEDYEIFSLTTYLTPVDRNKRIKEIDKKIEAGKRVIVISTQLIEAGVDLSFEEVYRDLGPLDSIVQVAGRCNRNGELGARKGEVKIIKLKEEENSSPYCQRVYDTILIDFCEEILKDKGRYSARDFIDLSKDYFARIRESVKRESKQLLNAICELNYSKGIDGQTPIKDFELIKYQGGKEDIIICKEEEVEVKIEHLEELYYELKEVGNDRKRLNSLIGQMELIKKELAQYRISVYQNQLREYYEHHIIEEFRFIKYVTYENQKEYLYSEEVGFLKEPKKPFQSCMIL